MTQASMRREPERITTHFATRAMALATLAAALSSICILGPATALADVPPLLPIQGYLTDKQGAAINGNKNVAFRLYAAPTGGTPLHEETLQIVAVDGYFTAYLGDDSGHPLDLTKLRDNARVFLGIEVDTDGEGQPRLQIATTAFAAQAAYCGDANSLGGKVSSAYAGASHTHTWSEITSKPDMFQPTPHTHGDADIACYADLSAEGYLDNNSPNDLVTQSQGDNRYAFKNHPHDAGEIQSGILNEGRYSAYMDLGSEGYFDNNSGGDLVLQAQGDMRFVNTNEPSSVNSNMIGDGTVQAADLAVNSVPMDRTTGPIGTSTTSLAIGTAATTFYLMNGQPFVADSNGVCVVTVNLRCSSASAPTGYYYTVPSYQLGAGSPTSANNTTFAYGMPTVVASSWQTTALGGMVQVTAGNTYQFGCSAYISTPGSTFVGATYVCQTSWVCN